jgi:nicotinamidase-related amidase
LLRHSQRAADGSAFVKRTWGAAIGDDLSPEAGDIVIEGKRSLDTFAGTSLDFIWRSKGHHHDRSRWPGWPGSSGNPRAV